jgi:hypothetical protein
MMRSGNYPSALKIFRKINDQEARLSYLSMIRQCYVKTDSMEQVRQVDREIIAFKDDKHDLFSKSIKVDACDELAKYCLKENDYKMALYYEKLYAAEFVEARFNDANLLRFHFFNANEQAHCFAAMGQIDSAIMVMTPYMFCNYNNLNQNMFVPENYHDPVDSLKHDTVCRFYVSLLRQQFSKKEIKAEFAKAENTFGFLEKKHDPDIGYLWEEITCSIDIYGQHFIIYQKGIGDQSEKLLKEISKPEYIKQYQLKRFHDLPVCRMVREL